jgi:RimJ/RimL family protein N-acetyltransferase
VYNRAAQGAFYGRGAVFAPTTSSTPDFTIRTYFPGDGVALQAATVTSYDHLRPWMPWASMEQTCDEAEALCRRFYAAYLRNEDYVLGVWRDDDLLGGTGFHLRHGGREQGTIEVGMWIRASAAGGGLGTKVLAALLDWGFSAWGWERIVWVCDTRNAASVRVAEKNGLTYEGVLRADRLDVNGIRRDTAVFAILRPEWLARQP